MHLMRTLKQHKFRAALRQAIEREQRELEKDGQRQRLTAVEYFALRSQVRTDVGAYLLEHGEDGLTQALVEKWTGEATKRCLTQMISAIVDEPPTPEMLAAARERIQRKLEAQPFTMRQEEPRTPRAAHVAALIPAAPSPAYIARAGVGQLEKLDIFVELNGLMADARLLRASAIRKGPDGTETVKNPRTFDRAISRRLEILGTSIATQKELWDLQRMEAFYTTIIETIASAAPEVAREIQRRLSEMNIHVGAV